MKEQLKNIIDALEELHIESIQSKATDDRYWYVDHYIDKAKTALKGAVRSLEGEQ